MKHGIKMGIYLIVSIFLLVLAGALELSTEKTICLNVFGVVYLTLFVNEVLDYAFDSAYKRDKCSDKDNSEKKENRS